MPRARGVDMADRAFASRMYPDRKQADLMNRTFGRTRSAWNRMPTEKRSRYLLAGDTLKNTPSHLKTASPWLREADAMALCNVRLDQEKAFAGLFRNHGRFSGSRITRASTGTSQATPRVSSGQTSPSRTRDI
ncbi:MAG: helix-turn-helix domain-containing protein [Deltaproteobacteria bacterium]|nr:helix-turn-helix domain-containing protein [Deltaproteobacteria bacterium]